MRALGSPPKRAAGRQSTSQIQNSSSWIRADTIAQTRQIKGLNARSSSSSGDERCNDTRVERRSYVHDLGQDTLRCGRCPRPNRRTGARSWLFATSVWRGVYSTRSTEVHTKAMGTASSTHEVRGRSLGRTHCSAKRIGRKINFSLPALSRCRDADGHGHPRRGQAFAGTDRLPVENVRVASGSISDTAAVFIEPLSCGHQAVTRRRRSPAAAPS